MKAVFKACAVSALLLIPVNVFAQSATSDKGATSAVRDGFVDENGAFVMNGPDMNGQPVRLRGADGVSLSKPGKRKVAFYVEKPLNKLLGTEAVPAPGPGPETVGPVAPANIYVDRTQPMAIDDPELDGGQVLLGATTEPTTRTRTVAERLVVEGIAAAPAPGRADDFGGAATPVATSAPAIQSTGAAVQAAAPDEDATSAAASPRGAVINR